MAFDSFQYSKTWRSSDDFPTIETEEAQVRDDIQCLYDEIAAGLNALIRSLNAGGVDTEQLNDGAVTTDKLANGAVTTAKLADDAVVFRVPRDPTAADITALNAEITSGKRVILCTNDSGLDARFIKKVSNQYFFSCVYNNRIYTSILTFGAGHGTWGEIVFDAYPNPGAAGIQLTDLASDVQTSLGKADTAYQKPAGGIPLSDLADDAKLGTVWTTTATPTPDVWDPDLLYFSRSDLVSNNPNVSPNSDELIIAGDKYYIIVGVSGNDVSVDHAVDWVLDGSVTTAKIQDKNVTKAKLDDSVQASLDKADTAYQKPVGGIPASDLASDAIPKNTVWITYGDTSAFDKIDAAYTDKKIVAVKYNDHLYYLATANGEEMDGLTVISSYTFVCLDEDGMLYYVKCETGSPGDVWTNGSIDLTSGGGGGTSEVFWATYGTTTSAQIEAAYQAGKEVLCNRNGLVYRLCDRASTTEHFFSTVKDDEFLYIACESDVWSYDSTAPLTRTPTASEVGAVAVAQGVAHAGEFVVVGSDGNITTVTMTAWAGGNY